MNRTIGEAVDLAIRAHGKQVDKSGKPYVAHPLRVMASALARGASDEEAMAAVLHDVVEDTWVHLNYLVSAGYPTATVKLVDALSRRNSETYVQFIGRIIATGTQAALLKLDDIADNLSSERMAALEPSVQASLTIRYESSRDRLLAFLGQPHPIDHEQWADGVAERHGLTRTGEGEQVD